MIDYVKEHKLSREKVNDAHFHITRMYDVDVSISNLEKMRSFFNLNKILIHALNDTNHETDYSNNACALYYKANMDNVYAFANFERHGEVCKDADAILEQAKRFIDMGFDGIKILDGKPEYRAERPQITAMIDSDLFDKFFAWAELCEIPVTIHCGDFMYKDNEREYNALLNVLNKYPKLHLTLAHFLFMQDEPERLTKIFDSFPNIRVDLALGGSFVLRFSENLEYFTKFFVKYQDRMLYGTDSYNQKFKEEEAERDAGIRHSCLRDFFEAKEGFYPVQYQNCAAIYGKDRIMINPMTDLPKEVLDKIYRTNFVDFVGETPRKIERDKVYEYAKEILEKYHDSESGYSTYSTIELPSYFSDEERANMKRGHALATENLEKIIKYFND